MSTHEPSLPIISNMRNLKRSEEMNSGLQRVRPDFCVPAKALSAASFEALAAYTPNHHSPGAAFSPQQMQIGAISVDTTGREVSGQKGTCVQWR
jgi:hypothetical protein